MSAAELGRVEISRVGGARRSPLRAAWKARTPYLFLSPALIVLGIIILYPIFFNLDLSFRDVKLIAQTTGPLVGLKNYAYLATDEDFWNSMRVSAVFTALSVPVAFLCGLGVALLMNELGRTRSFFLTLLLIPWIISPVVTGYAWRWIYNDQFGLLNKVLTDLHVIDQYVGWLAAPDSAMAALIVANVWRFIPYIMVMLLAGLQSVPPELYEAAEVDGAGVWARFVNVTVSELRYVMGVVMLFSLIWSFNDFALPYILTQGGPSKATTVLPILVYRVAFEALRLGRGAALAMIILVVLLFFALVYVRRLLSEETKGA